MTSWEQRTQKVLSALQLDSIKNQIVVLALLATLIPALGTALLSYRQNKRTLTDNLDVELRSIGSQTSRELALWVGGHFLAVRVFTGSFEVSENLERIPQGGAAGAVARTRLTDYLVGVHGRLSEYAELLVTDVEARTVASSSDALREVSLPPESLIRLSRGETVLGEPYRDGARAGVAATLAVPIETADAGFIGVLAATLMFDAVEDSILGSFAPGEAGRVDLITRDGSLIVSSRGTSASGPAAAVAEGVLDQLRAAAGGSAEYVDGDGVSVVGTLTEVPGLPWAVIAQIPYDEAFAPVRELRNSAFLLVSFLLVVVGGIAYFVGLVIVRPLARLTAGAGAVAAGDLSVDLPAAGHGEVGYLTEVFNGMVGRLQRSRKELDERNQELERLSVTDLLTGLHNRRYLLDAFDQEIHRADRHERCFCVLMIDVDRFKNYNDTHGHLAGDEVLAAMGSVIRDATREVDVSARYGGEEFIVLLPECDVENAVVAAERIRTRLSQESFEGGPVTISVGAAEFPGHGDSPSGVIAAADGALYEAKRKGRDQVQAAQPKPDTATKKRGTKRTAAAKEKRA